MYHGFRFILITYSRNNNDSLKIVCRSHDLTLIISTHLNPAMKVFKQFFRRLFSWKSLIVLLLLGKIERTNLVKTVQLQSQNCNKEVEKAIVTDLSYFGFWRVISQLSLNLENKSVLF